jgi:hypothetical protein
MKQRVSIDRLALDLRGIDPLLAQAAVRLLGAALEARLSGAAPAAIRGTDAQALAHHLADRVAHQIPTAQAAQEG